MHPSTTIQSMWRGYSYRSRVKWLKFIQTPRFKAYRDFCYALCIQDAFRTYYRQKKLHTQVANIQVLFRNYILKKYHNSASRKIQNWWREEIDYKKFWCASCIQDAMVYFMYSRRDSNVLPTKKIRDKYQELTEDEANQSGEEILFTSPIKKIRFRDASWWWSSD